MNNNCIASTCTWSGECLLYIHNNLLWFWCRQNGTFQTMIWVVSPNQQPFIFIPFEKWCGNTRMLLAYYTFWKKKKEKKKSYDLIILIITNKKDILSVDGECLIFMGVLISFWCVILLHAQHWKVTTLPIHSTIAPSSSFIANSTFSQYMHVV